jgi:hypothetical protein
MEYIMLLPIAGIVMALFSTVVMAFYAILEDEYHKNEIRRYARKQIMRQLEQEDRMAGKMNEKIDLLSEYKS